MKNRYANMIFCDDHIQFTHCRFRNMTRQDPMWVEVIKAVSLIPSTTVDKFYHKCNLVRTAMDDLAKEGIISDTLQILLNIQALMVPNEDSDNDDKPNDEDSESDE